MITSRLSDTLATALLISLSSHSFAATFSWTPGNTDIVVHANSLELTMDGITVTAQAFTAELNETGIDASVVGAWSAKNTSSTGPGFGIDVRGLGSEQMGLLADPSLIPSANGSDICGGGVSPGFGSKYRCSSISAFHFALFSFSQPVDIPGVTVDDVTNYNRSIWMAAGTTAPDFSGGFLSGLTGFNVVNSADDAGDGFFTHGLGATDISYLLVGAPPQENLGPLTSGNSQFYIDSFGATEAVPVPAAVWLFVSGLLGTIGFSRRKKAH